MKGKDMRQIWGCTAVLAALSMGVTMALAQSETDTSDIDQTPSEIIVEEITNEALQFTDDIGELITTLENLPSDLAGAPAMYDAMIEAIDGVLEEVGEGSPLADSVGNLRTEAETQREEWRARCEETGETRDCERIELWNDRVVAALDAEDRYVSMIRSIMESRGTIDNNRVYVEDDIRLALFDQALASLNASLDELGRIRDLMSELAVSVGGDPLPPLERETEG